MVDSIRSARNALFLALFVGAALLFLSLSTNVEPPNYRVVLILADLVVPLWIFAVFGARSLEIGAKVDQEGLHANSIPLSAVLGGAQTRVIDPRSVRRAVIVRVPRGSVLQIRTRRFQSATFWDADDPIQFKAAVQWLEKSSIPVERVGD